jgi:hypothetical protein
MVAPDQFVAVGKLVSKAGTVGMNVPRVQDLAGWAGEHTQPRSVGFLQRSVLFLSKPYPRRVSRFPVAWVQHAGGRMTFSTLILILLLTFAGAGALERLRSTLIK